MNSQDFLIYNLAAAGGFLLWYLSSRGGANKPTQLNLKAPNSVGSNLKALPVQNLQVELKTSTKTLNVIFNYNGHSWDAYEVLGVPAGASLPTVTEAYQKAIRKSDSHSLDFLETAYKSILNKSF